MDIQFYETFIEVASTLNFRAASENLKVVQSTVSNRIQALEDFYGQPLFNRSNKKVSLTSAGLILLPFAGRIVMLQNEALKQTNNVKVRDGKIRIGIEPHLYYGELKNRIRMFSKENPKISVALELQKSNDVLKKLSDGLLDIGFVYNKSKNQTLEFVPHNKDGLVFVIDKGHVLSSSDVVEKTALLDLDLVHVNYGPKYDNWLGQVIPEGFEYAIEVDSSINPTDHIAGLGRAGVILESELETSDYSDLVKQIRIKGLDMPYFQSYFAYKKEENRIDEVTLFMASLNRQN